MRAYARHWRDHLRPGWIAPSQVAGQQLRIQPAAAVAWKRLDYLREAGTYWDIGSNIYLDGHHAKVSIQYSSRPIYGQETRTIADRKGEWIIQLQVYL